MTGTIVRMADRIGVDAFMRQERAIIARIDSRPHLAAIRCPTLVVAARHDAIMPVAMLEELAAWNRRRHARDRRGLGARSHDRAARAGSLRNWRNGCAHRSLA